MINKFVRQKVWRKGEISNTRYESLASLGRAIVNLTDKQPNIPTKPLPVLFPFTGIDKSYFMPKPGDKVIVLMDEQNEDGIILGSFYTKQNKPSSNPAVHYIEFEDGTKLEYDKNNQEIIISSAKDIIIKSEGIVKINPVD